MGMTGRAIVLVPLLPVLLAAGKIDPHNPPEGRFLDDWAEIYMAGGKVGYAHSTMTREGKEIRTQTAMTMRIGRVDQPVEIETVQSTTESLDGSPARFSMDLNASVMKTSMRGTIKDGKVTVVTSQYGMEQTQAFDFPSGALMGWGLFRDGLLRKYDPGTQYTVKTYAPEFRLDGPVDAVTKVGDWEEFEQQGRKRRGQRVSITMESPIGAIELHSWVDEHRNPLKAEIPMAGLGNIVMITTTQEKALADFIPPEIFLKSSLKAGRALQPEKLARVKYRIRPTQPDIDLSDIPATGMQTPAKRDDGSVDLRVVRQSHKKPESPERRLSADELREFLEPNLNINTADPKLVELGRSAGGEEKDPYKLADRLRRFVTDFVTSKSLNIGFATASEVARTKEGDCSEHGVLLAALARLNGIPSRVAVGLAYVPVFGGESDVFGYHLWTQFYIDGRWIDVDAALRETECSPIRIAFATSSLKNTGLADLTLPLLSKIGAIAIDIVEVEPR